MAKPDLYRSLPKEDHMLQGRMIASKELIFGSNVDATAMYDFVPTTKLKGNEDFVEETEFYERYESIDTSSSVPIDVLPEKHLVFPALLNAYGASCQSKLRKSSYSNQKPKGCVNFVSCRRWLPRVCDET